LCTEDPGKDVDLYLTTDLRTMVEVWQGDLDFKQALKDERMETHGTRKLIKTMPDWIGFCKYMDVRPVSSIKS